MDKQSDDLQTLMLTLSVKNARLENEIVRIRAEFTEYARQVVRNAKALADELMVQGLKLVTDGTDNHLMVIDLRPLGVDGKGKKIQNALDVAGITVNKNAVPFDNASPLNPSGIRLGTPALTPQGMKEEEMGKIGEWIGRAVKNYRDVGVLKKMRDDVAELASEFPLYPGYKVSRVPLPSQILGHRPMTHAGSLNSSRHGRLRHSY